MMKKRLIGTGLMLAGLCAALGGALAEPTLEARPQNSLIDSLSLDSARQLLAGEHYRTETVAGGGGPYLKTRAGETYFFVSLYDCAEPAKAEGCHTLELTTGAFAIRPAPTGEELARWNAASPFGFGVFDSAGSPYLRALVPLAGGVAPSHVKAALSLWAGQIAAFSRFLERTANPPAAAAAPAAPGTPPPASSPDAAALH